MLSVRVTLPSFLYHKFVEHAAGRWALTDAPFLFLKFCVVFFYFFKFNVFFFLFLKFHHFLFLPIKFHIIMLKGVLLIELCNSYVILRKHNNLMKDLVKILWLTKLLALNKMEFFCNLIKFGK